MKICLIASMIVILASVIAGQEQKVLTAEDFATGKVERGSGRESLALKIQINKSLPPFTFHIIPDPAVDDSRRSDNSLHHVGWIEISSGDSNSVRQKIDVSTRTGAYDLTRSFTAEDVNFDGFLDIAVFHDGGAKWVRLDYWLYDTRTGRFVTSPLTRELKRLTFAEMERDTKTKTITFVSYISTCPQNESYKIMDGHLVLMKTQTTTCTVKGQEVFVKVIVKKRVNGRMKLVKTKLTKEALQ